MRFFLLVFALSVPFWVLGAVTDLQLMPGLSISALMIFCPAAAALILLYRENRTTGATDLLWRSFDFRRITRKRWYLPALFLMPVVSIVVYTLMRSMHLPLPAPRLTAVGFQLTALGFFVGALGEELGWSGCVLDTLQARWTAFGAGHRHGSPGDACMPCRRAS